MSARNGTPDIAKLMESCYQRMSAQEAIITKLTQDLTATCAEITSKADKMDRTCEMLLGKVMADPATELAKCFSEIVFSADVAKDADGHQEGVAKFEGSTSANDCLAITCGETAEVCENLSSVRPTDAEVIFAHIRLKNDIF